MTEEEMLQELSENLDEFEGDTIPDKDIFGVEELLDRIVGAVHLLDHIDEYKMQISKKRREVDWKMLDLLHLLETQESKITAKGCKNIVEEIAHCRKLRRTLKVSDELIYEFQKRYNRLNNQANRKMVVADINREKNRLTQDYKNRVYTTEQLNELIDAKEKASQKKTAKEDVK